MTAPQRLCDYPGCDRPATTYAQATAPNTGPKEWFGCDRHPATRDDSDRTGPRLPPGWRVCPGGPAETMASQQARCPGCGFLFSTLVDHPSTRPHLVGPDRSVVFVPDGYGLVVDHDR